MLFRENEIARKAATSLYRKTCIFNRLGYHDLRSVPTWKAQRGAHFARSAQLAWSRDRISSTKSIKGVKPTRRAAGRSWRLAMVEVPDPAPVPTISAVSPSFIRPFIATVVVGRRGQRLTRPTLRPVRFAERSAEGRSRRENTSRIRETSGRINRTDTKELAHTPAASTNPAIGPASRSPARVASAPLVTSGYQRSRRRYLSGTKVRTYASARIIRVQGMTARTSRDLSFQVRAHSLPPTSRQLPEHRSTAVQL